MLFTVKRRAGPALGLAAALVLVAVVSRRLLGLAWSLEPDGTTLLADGHRVAALTPLGRPAKTPPAPARRTVEDLLLFERMPGAGAP